MSPTQRTPSFALQPRNSRATCFQFARRGHHVREVVAEIERVRPTPAEGYVCRSAIGDTSRDDDTAFVLRSAPYRRHRWAAGVRETMTRCGAESTGKIRYSDWMFRFVRTTCVAVGPSLVESNQAHRYRRWFRQELRTNETSQFKQNNQRRPTWAVVQTMG